MSRYINNVSEGDKRQSSAVECQQECHSDASIVQPGQVEVRIVQGRRYRVLRCLECGEPTQLAWGWEVGFRLEYSWQLVWACKPCRAHVSCHGNTQTPLGRPAGAKTRAARHLTHQAFDPLWWALMEREGLPKKMARDLAYRWLAEKLGIPAACAHVAYFDYDQCMKAIDICTREGGELG